MRPVFFVWEFIFCNLPIFQHCLEHFQFMPHVIVMCAGFIAHIRLLLRRVLTVWEVHHFQRPIKELSFNWMWQTDNFVTMPMYFLNLQLKRGVLSAQDEWVQRCVSIFFFFFKLLAFCLHLYTFSKKSVKYILQIFWGPWSPWPPPAET